MLNRGKPKDAELTVIGLSSSKNSKRNNIKPSITTFIKLKGTWKDRTILECVVSPSAARNALKGVLLIGAEEIKININKISDLIRNDYYVDFNRIEKYFQEEVWLECLKVCEQKKRSKWMCSTCQKVLAKNTDSLVCGRCLKWCHLSCTILVCQFWNLEKDSKTDKLVLQIM